MPSGRGALTQRSLPQWRARCERQPLEELLHPATHKRSGSFLGKSIWTQHSSFDWRHNCIDHLAGRHWSLRQLGPAWASAVVAQSNETAHPNRTGDMEHEHTCTESRGDNLRRQPRPFQTLPDTVGMPLALPRLVSRSKRAVYDFFMPASAGRLISISPNLADLWKLTAPVTRSMHPPSGLSSAARSRLILKHFPIGT